MKIGSHVSNSGDGMLLNSALEAISYGANALMVYLGPPQSTMRKDVNRLNIDKFHIALKEGNIDINDVIIHAPYIVNLASPDLEKRNFGIDFITREMKVMNIVGAKYMVLHPGAHMKEGIEKGLELICDSLTKILNNTKDDDTYIALETMAGKGSECCFQFEHLKTIIESVNSSRLVVCFDTCHTHDAGYDLINNYESVIDEFDNLIGIDKIKVIHLNDSLNEREAHKDRHANIGFGKIGFSTLLKIANDERFKNVPKILETPYIKVSDTLSLPPYKEEILMIRSGNFNENLLEEIIATAKR